MEDWNLWVVAMGDVLLGGGAEARRGRWRGACSGRLVKASDTDNTTSIGKQGFLDTYDRITTPASSELAMSHLRCGCRPRGDVLQRCTRVFIRNITSGETARSDIGLAAWPGQGYEGMALGDMKAPGHASLAVATGESCRLGLAIICHQRTDQKKLTGQQRSNAKQPGMTVLMARDPRHALPVPSLGPDSSHQPSRQDVVVFTGQASLAPSIPFPFPIPISISHSSFTSSSCNLYGAAGSFCAIQRDAIQGQSSAKDQAAEPPGASGPRAPFSRLDTKIALATTVQLQPDSANRFPAHSCERKHVPFCDVVVGISESEQRPQQLIQIFPVELVARKPTFVVALSLRSASKLYQVKQTTHGNGEPITRTKGARKRTSAAAISHLIARGDPVGIPSQAEWRTQTQDVTRPNEEAISAGSLVWFLVATRSQQRTHLSTWRLDVVSARGIGPGYASAFSLEAESLSPLSPERHPGRSFHFDERQDDTREWRTQEADKSACLQNRKTRPCHPWHPISSHLSGGVFHSINHGREPSRVTQRRFRFGQDRSCIDQLPAASRTLGASATAATNNIPDAEVQALLRLYG
ncbi:hypothetical protein CPLU01_08407 [Colletotrichum plurivorum]|uniref:Uncharacterized protein n=1 Tax=Colletotrichum plurivorum TaxID=2175906 RepID=A0A8H6KCY2_9PEZI|nr:hypothetical protein CPLU01_08407 [Colletotrichum plurivorum]